MRRSALATTAVITAGTIAPGAASAATSAASQQASARAAAAAQVGYLTSGTGRGSAVRVGPHGDWLTSSVLVARTSEITVTGSDGKAQALGRVLSDAPNGLALLEPRTKQTTAGLAIATTSVKKGERVWIVYRQRNGNKLHTEQTTVASNNHGAISLSRVTLLGGNGGPILNAAGQVVGVTSPPQPGAPKHSPQHAIGLTTVPTADDAVPTAGTSSFPAVPVTVGLGVLLLVSEIFVAARRRRNAPASPVPASAGGSAPAAAAATAAAAPADDFEITLRPKG